MADRPELPVAAALAAHRAGRISAEVALMRILLAGVPAGALPGLLAGDPALRCLAARHADGLASLERMVAAGAAHGQGTDLDATRAMFDRLVAIAPEASVAAWSLGDPARLEAATAALVGWLRGLGLLAGRPRVLDLGCGIGRVAGALAPEAAEVLGLDLSPAMVAAARARHAAPNLRFATCSGRDLAGVADRGVDLLLAVDVFPYLVQAGTEAAMLAEAARVLRPGGHAMVINFDYAASDGGLARLGALAPACGLRLEAGGARPLPPWDGIAFRLRRPGVAGGCPL